MSSGFSSITTYFPSDDTGRCLLTLFVIEFANLYAPGLLAAIIPSVTVVWATKHGNAGLKKELMEEIHGVRQHLEGAIIVSGRNVISAIDGNKEPMREWLANLDKCRQSGGC